jgi:hypothetical protein
MTKAKRRRTLSEVLFNRIGEPNLLFWVEFKDWLKPKKLLDVGQPKSRRIFPPNSTEPKAHRVTG